MIIEEQFGDTLGTLSLSYCGCAKLIKTLNLLARPTRFELVTLGLEMQWIGYTNYIVLHRFVILQYLFYSVSTKMA